MKQFVFLLAAYAIILSACSKKDDDSVDINNPAILKLQFDTTTVQAGDTLKLDVLFVDDMGLSQAKLDIHDDFDGHQHGRIQAPFNWNTVVNLQGVTSYNKAISIPIPSDASAGPYHFSAIVTDLAGNESPISVAGINILHRGQPVMDVVKPDPEVFHSFQVGEVIVLEGLVSDDIDLQEITVRLIHSGTEKVIFQGDHDLKGNADKSFELSELSAYFTVTIPFETQSGSYELEIMAVDSDENRTIQHVTMQITE